MLLTERQKESKWLPQRVADMLVGGYQWKQPFHEEAENGGSGGSPE